MKSKLQVLLFTTKVCFFFSLIDECIEIEKIRDRTRLELLEREANEDDEEEELDDTDRESQATNGRDATETTS